MVRGIAPLVLLLNFISLVNSFQLTGSTCDLNETYRKANTIIEFLRSVR